MPRLDERLDPAGDVAEQGGEVDGLGPEGLAEVVGPHQRQRPGDEPGELLGAADDLVDDLGLLPLPVRA